MNTYGGGYVSHAPPAGGTLPCDVTINNKWGTLYIFKVTWSGGGASPPCEKLQFVKVCQKGESYTETIPVGQNVWYRFKTANNTDCSSSIVKWEMNGIGNCHGPLQKEIL